MPNLAGTGEKEPVRRLTTSPPSLLTTPYHVLFYITYLVLYYRKSIAFAYVINQFAYISTHWS
jgi:hypothetical protein